MAELAVTFALDESDELLSWLSAITGEPLEQIETGEWRYRGPGGLLVGLAQLDPVSVAISVGMIMAGMWWPYMFPTLLDDTKKLWHERTGNPR